MAIIAAEAVKSNSGKGKSKKTTLSHLEIHPKLGGGHVVKHVYGYEHEPRNYSFAKGQGARALAHVARHAGMPLPGGDQEIEEQGAEDEAASEE